MTARAMATLFLAGALALTGCSGGASSAPTAEGTTRSTGTTLAASPATTAATSAATHASSATHPTSTPTTPSTPHPTIKVRKGVKLTPEGTVRTYGERATVAWHPRLGVVGVAVIRVTDLQQVSITRFHNFVLSARISRSTPYFVHGTVANIGRSDLSGYAVPLYLLDRRQTLVESSSFGTKFKPCRSKPLPKSFRQGVRVPFCLVYFAPDHALAKAVSFRPTRSATAIRWQSTIAPGGH